MPKKVVLLTLQTFSATGGIQKMTRTLAHSLSQICRKNLWGLKVMSLYDAGSDLIPKYLPAENFEGFDMNRWQFVSNTLRRVKHDDILILSHINFAMIGLLVKVLRPRCQVWLIAHGIEVWRPLSFQRKLFLKYCDKILCVSLYTKSQMISRHQARPETCAILNNAIDPFIKLPAKFAKPQRLLSKYGLTENNLVVFTLTRLASTEKYKGYDNVIYCISQLKKQFPGIKYILSGKYDEKEQQRVNSLIAEWQVADQVILTGFIEEEDLADYFLLADLFVLPSKKEGFGIVFIEALACGLPVICGNADGSVDAIRNGELGQAIDPDNEEELRSQIAEHLLNPLTLERRRFLQQKSLQYFNEEAYIESLKKLLAC